ncbi:MAG: response regulator [candidate division WOR-3 bacterium]
MSQENGHKTILVVDDEEDIRLVLEARLTAAGFRVETAANGMEALSRIRSSPPDLIVLDLMLPGIDGFGICGMVKRDQRFSHIPIIMLTARVQPNDRKTSAKLGADAFIAKPFQAEELIRQIRQLLEPAREDGVDPSGSPLGQPLPTPA